MRLKAYIPKNFRHRWSKINNAFWQIYLVFKKWKVIFNLYWFFHLLLCLFPHLSVIFPSIYAFTHRLTASIAVIYCLDIIGHLKVTSFLWLHILKCLHYVKLSIDLMQYLSNININFHELQLIHLECGCNWKNLQNFQAILE